MESKEAMDGALEVIVASPLSSENEEEVVSENGTTLSSCSWSNGRFGEGNGSFSTSCAILVLLASCFSRKTA